MATCFMSRVITSNGRAMVGVLLELENNFHATPVELNAASTTQDCILLGACKQDKRKFKSAFEITVLYFSVSVFIIIHT